MTVHAQKTPTLLIIGFLMLVWGGLTAGGYVDDMQSWLQASAYKDHIKVKEKFDAELRVATELAAAQGKPAPVMTMPKTKFDEEKAKQANLSLLFGGIFGVLGLVTLAVQEMGVGDLVLMQKSE